MERLLRSLFDYQRFEHNSDLQRTIDDTQNRHFLEANILHDDMLEFNAAGDPHVFELKRPKDE